MVQSRATTPAHERNYRYRFCPRTGVQVDDGWSLDPEWNKVDRLDGLPLFRPPGGDPMFEYCGHRQLPAIHANQGPQFRTGLPVKEVMQGGWKYLPATVGANGKPLEIIFCTKSGRFLGEYCPYTGKNAADSTTKGGKLIAKTWDSVQQQVISHKFDIHTGVSLKGVSDPGVRTTSTNIASTKKNKSQSAGSSKSGPGSPLKPTGPIKYPAKPESHRKPATTKPKTKAKPAKPAASKRPTRTRKKPERLIDETLAHPAVKKTTREKAAPKNTAAAKIGAGVTKKKPAAKKAPAERAATTPKKTAAKQAAAKKPAAKKSGSMTGAGVKKVAMAKPKANTKKVILKK